MDRGSQYLGYDFWWHITQDTLLTSEWGTPRQVEDGVVPEELLQGRYGHQMHVWDLRKRRHVQALDLGKEYQMVLEMRPAHDPTKTYGFAGVVVSRKDLSGSIWLWHRQNGSWQVRKVIEIPAEPADPEKLPPLLQGFQSGASSGHRYRSLVGRSVSLRLLLGYRGIYPVRCIRPFPSKENGLGSHRRDCSTGATSCRTRQAAAWWSTNG